MVRRLKNLAACGCMVASLALGLAASSASAAIYVYDPNVNPNLLPQNVPSSPWTEAASPNPVQDSRSMSNNVLTVYNNFNPDSLRSYYWYNIGGPLQTQLSSTVQYEMRTRVRIGTDYGGSGVGDLALWTSSFEDGTRWVTLGVSRINSGINTGATRFFFVQGGSGFPDTDTTPYATLTAPLRLDGFYDVYMRKVGTTGGASDFVEVYVDGVLALSQSYNLFSALAGTRQINFGMERGGGVSGTFQITGATFGIGEFAPTVPEPATVSVVGAVVGLVTLRRRR